MSMRIQVSGRRNPSVDGDPCSGYRAGDGCGGSSGRKRLICLRSCKSLQRRKVELERSGTETSAAVSGLYLLHAEEKEKENPVEQGSEEMSQRRVFDPTDLHDFLILIEFV